MILFQGGIYAIMAFSAKASEARSRPHDLATFMQMVRFLVNNQSQCYAYP